MTEKRNDRVDMPVEKERLHVSLQDSRPCQGLLEGTVNWTWLSFIVMASRLLSSLNVYEAVVPEFVFTEESGIFLISQGQIGL